MNKFLPIILLAPLVFLSGPAHAEELNYHLINLQAQAEQQVVNDLLVVVLAAVVEADTAAQAAYGVNTMMTWAGEIIRRHTSIHYETLNYRTNPRSKNRAIIGWTASQQIRLESSDFETLTTVAGQLQEQLGIVSMQFEVSSTKRKTAMDTLIAESLTSFNEKSRLITATLKAKDFRIVSISVNEGGQRPEPRLYAMEAAAMTPAPPPPEVAAGDSMISATVHGTIQLIY